MAQSGVARSVRLQRRGSLDGTRRVAARRRRARGCHLELARRDAASRRPRSLSPPARARSRWHCEGFRRRPGHRCAGAARSRGRVRERRRRSAHLRRSSVACRGAQAGRAGRIRLVAASAQPCARDHCRWLRTRRRDRGSRIGTARSEPSNRLGVRADQSGMAPRSAPLRLLEKLDASSILFGPATEVSDAEAPA